MTDQQKEAPRGDAASLARRLGAVSRSLRHSPETRTPANLQAIEGLYRRYVVGRGVRAEMIAEEDAARKASLHELIMYYASASADVRDARRMVDQDSAVLKHRQRFEILEAELMRRLRAVGDYVDRGYLVSVDVDDAWRGEA